MRRQFIQRVILNFGVSGVDSVKLLGGQKEIKQSIWKPSMWLVIEQEFHAPVPCQVVHVSPDETMDIREHETSYWPRLKCWCNPRLEDYTETNGGFLLVHNQTQ